LAGWNYYRWILGIICLGVLLVGAFFIGRNSVTTPTLNQLEGSPDAHTWEIAGDNGYWCKDWATLDSKGVKVYIVQECRIDRKVGAILTG